MKKKRNFIENVWKTIHLHGKIIDLDYKVVLWPDNVQEKDINDMILAGRTKEEVTEIINNNTYQGLKAKIKFSLWSKQNV